MSYPHHELVGAINSLMQFVTDNTTALTAKNLTPASLTTALTNSRADASAKDGVQENAKTALTVATDNYNLAANDAYHVFSSMIDLISGGVGKQTALAKQARAIRTKLNKKKSGNGGGSSSSSSSSTSGSSSSSSSSSSS